MQAQKRFATKEKASLEVYGKSGTQIVDLKDLSESGACLEFGASDVPLAKGDFVRMTIILKALNRRHDISAEVVWVKDNHTGVSFIPADQVLERIIGRTNSNH